MAAAGSYQSLVALLRQANTKARKRLGKGDVEGVRQHAEELRAALEEAHAEGAGEVVGLISLARMRGAAGEHAEEATLYARIAGLFMQREHARYREGGATLDQDAAKALLAAGYAIQRYAELRAFTSAYCLSAAMAESLERLNCLDLAAVYFSIAADAIGCNTTDAPAAAVDVGTPFQRHASTGSAGAERAGASVNTSLNLSFATMNQYFSPHRHFPGGSASKHTTPSLMQAAALYRAFVCFLYVWDVDAALDRLAQLLPPEDVVPAPGPTAREVPSGAPSQASSPMSSPRARAQQAQAHAQAAAAKLQQQQTAPDDAQGSAPASSAPTTPRLRLPAATGTAVGRAAAQGESDASDDDSAEGFWCAPPPEGFYSATQQRTSASEDLLVSLALLHLARLDIPAAYDAIRRLEATRSTRHAVFLHILAEEVEQRDTAAADAPMLLIAPGRQLQPPFTLPVHLFLYQKVVLAKLHPVATV